jgi:hypothetical protein
MNHSLWKEDTQLNKSKVTTQPTTFADENSLYLPV